MYSEIARMVFSIRRSSLKAGMTIDMYPPTISKPPRSVLRATPANVEHLERNELALPHDQPHRERRLPAQQAGDRGPIPPAQQLGIQLAILRTQDEIGPLPAKEGQVPGDRATITFEAVPTAVFQERGEREHGALEIEVVIGASVANNRRPGGGVGGDPHDRPWGRTGPQA